MTRAEMRAGLDLMATWALEQKAAANRQLIAAMRLRLAAGEQVARMYQEPGAGLAGAASRGRRGSGRRAPGGSKAPTSDELMAARWPLPLASEGLGALA